MSALRRASLNKVDVIPMIPSTRKAAARQALPSVPAATWAASRTLRLRQGYVKGLHRVGCKLQTFCKPTVCNGL